MKWFACALLGSLLATSACGGANDAIGDGGGDPADSGQVTVDSGGAGTGDGGSGGATCGASTACGGAGVTYEECTTTGPGGECVAIVYQTSDGRAFTCAGCTGCSTTQHDLAAYCGSQPSGDAGTVDSGTTAVDSGNQGGTTCLAPSACGSSGLTYSECTTTDRHGACSAIAYDVSDGNVYTCASCSDCAAAIQQLNTFCASQGTPTTTCTAMTPCESSPLTVETCTTSLGGACQSVAYQTSDSQVFTCAACGNCSAALSSLDAYCTAQTTPVTTCDSQPCGIGGATYGQCTTSQGAVCDSVAYTTSTGKTFTCNSCSDCTAALTSVETYCASLTATGGVVMFGGFDSTGAGLADTWVWNGSTWTAGPTTGPSARGDAVGAMLGGQFVLFGGIASTAATTNYGDTWAWTGTAWSELSTTGPAARFGGAMAPMGNELVMFGGDDTNTATTNLADTWLWNGGAWSTLSVSAPPARVGAAAASLNGQIVVFGGMSTSSTYLADTWVFNGTQWTQMTPATSPPARFYPSVATLDGQVVLFGGSAGTDLSDTWTWNGSTWTQLNVTGPAARAGATATAWNGGIVLFGGSESGTYVSDTWVWNGTAWIAKTATGPAARFGAAIGAY
jgi:hypothetical protein